MRGLPFGNVTGNGPFRLPPNVCPTCDQVIDNDKAKAIHARFQERKRELEQEYEHRFEARMKAMENEALAKGKEAGKAEAKEEVARLVGETSGLTIKLAEMTQRAEGAEANFADRVNEAAAAQAEVYRNKVQAEQEKKDYEAFEEIAKWKKKAAELQNAMEKQNAQKQGKVAERDIARELTHHFPHDKIEVISTGVRGADVLQHVYYRGKFVCTIIHESKFAERFLKDYPTKARADQIKASAAHAILWTKTMPTDVTDPWTHIEGVHVCEFPAGIAVTTLVRTFSIKLSTLEGDKRGERGQQMLDFMVSGGGMELLKTMIDNSEAEARLDKAEKQAHETVWNQRAANRAARENLLNTIIAEIYRISGVD